MAQNKFLIEQMKRLQRAIADLTPEIYSAFALTLSRKYGWTHEQINELFVETQDVWEECVERGIKMPQICYEETGIDVERRVNEKC